MSTLEEILLKKTQEQETKILLLEHELSQLKRMIFGAKSERFIPSAIPGQLTLDINGDKNEKVSEKETVNVASHDRNKKTEDKKHPVRNAFPENLRREIFIIKPEGDLTGCKKIGEEYTEILEVVKPEIYVKRYVREKYVCAEGGKIMIGELPSRALDKSLLGEQLVAQIIADKYVDHLPLYRQGSRFKRMGIDISVSTINDTVKNTCNLLEPLYACLQELTLSADYLNVDETTIKVLDHTKKADPKKKGKTHLGYYWVYLDGKKKLVFFQYRPGRGMEGPAKALKNFQGHLQTDGYSVYDAFDIKPGITLLGCMAHARRKFEEAKGNDAERAEYILSRIQELYSIEREIRDNLSKLTPEEIVSKRDLKSKPILKGLEEWFKENQSQVTPKSPIGKAIQYALTRWDKLSRYTENADLQIDNNLVENAIRPVAIGRKNFMFAGSHEGAKRAAMMYSFFGTCKLHNINPQEWLADVLVRINDTKLSQLHELLPQNWKPAVKEII